VTLARTNQRALSDTQPGRERPLDRPWGQGRSRPGCSPRHLRVGRNRRRAVIELIAVCDRRLSQRIRLGVRAALNVCRGRG
jgi:hypothetical protein